MKILLWPLKILGIMIIGALFIPGSILVCLYDVINKSYCYSWYVMTNVAIMEFIMTV